MSSAATSHHPVVAGNTETSAPSNRVYFPALDGLRAVAFLLVFLHHYEHLPYGWTGVDIFFVLSGFLITGILYDTADQPHRARNFYLRRTLRIFPLYYAVLLAVLISTPVFHWSWSWQWAAWPLYLGNFLRLLYPYASLTFVAPFADAFLKGHLGHRDISILLGHFWSLCVEEQFYLVWPWIVFAIRDRRKLMMICIASMVLVPLARAAALALLPATLVQGEVVLHSTPFRFDTLMYGAVLALLWRSSHRKALERWASRILWLIPLLAGWVFALYFRQGFYMPPAGLPTWGLCVVAILSSAVVVSTLVPGTFCYRVFHHRWLRALGVVSYGAYVFHDIPHNVYYTIATHTHLPVVHATTAIGLIATCLLAFASYRLIEAPFLALKEKLSSPA